MKRLLIPVLAITFIFTSCGGDDSQELESVLANAIEELEEVSEELEETEAAVDNLYHSEDGKFKINFNGEPTVSSDMIPTEVGDIEMTSFLYEKSITEAYMVAYNDYPSEILANSSVDDMLDGAKNGSASSMNIVSFDVEKDMEIAGNPGRYFKGNNGSYYIEYKLFLKANRLYQIAIIRDGSYATAERTDEFFGSFELLED